MLVTTGNNVCGRRLYACINTRKFKGLDSSKITSIIARDQKSDLHSTSFQSSPKINRMLITRPFAYVVVNFLSQVIFIFLLFLGMIMYANEV